MDTPFENLGREERQDWRDHPTTVAFLATLAGLRTGVANQVLNAVKGVERKPEALAELGGQLNALDYITQLARRDK